jgi:hypothetical protein
MGLLVSYLVGSNGQYPALDLITPLVVSAHIYTLAPTVTEKIHRVSFIASSYCKFTSI